MGLLTEYQARNFDELKYPENFRNLAVSSAYPGSLKSLKKWQKLAETERFELSVPNYQYDGLANRWFQPLTHVSGLPGADRGYNEGLRGGQGAHGEKISDGANSRSTRGQRASLRIQAGSTTRSSAKLTRFIAGALPWVDRSSHAVGCRL